MITGNLLMQSLAVFYVLVAVIVLGPNAVNYSVDIAEDILVLFSTWRYCTWR